MDSSSLLSYINEYRKLREPHEPVGFLSRKSYEGQHFVYWSRDLRRIISKEPARNLYGLPECANQVDKFENFILSTNFSFTLVPKLLSDEAALKASMYLGILARDDYKKLKKTNKLSNLIKFALFDNISFAEVAVNEKANDVDVKVWDMYEILFDPRIRDWENQKLVVKVIRKKKEDLIKSKLYNLPQRISSGDYTTWKDLFESEKYNFNITALKKDEIILFECFYLDEGSLRITTIDGGGNVYRDDKYDTLDHIPIYPFTIYSGSWYQPSFVYRLLPLNRMIDLIAKRINDMILRLAKGGWLVQEEEDIDASLNEEVGQIIRYSATKPEQVEMPNIPPFIASWFSNLFALTERFGITPIIAGQLPTKASNVRSQDMIESLVSQAYQNYSNTIESFRNILTNILRDIFNFRYFLWKTPKELTITSLGQELRRVKFVSQKYDDVVSKTDKDEIVFIPDSYDRFDVEIDNALGYTLDAQKQNAIQLAQLGLIDKKVVKNIFKLGSTAYLLEADEKMAIETPDFQALIKNFDSLSKEEQQALTTTLRLLGRVSPQAKEMDAQKQEEILKQLEVQSQPPQQ
jgi:hypothetical protein